MEPWQPASPAIVPRDLPALVETKPFLVVHVWAHRDGRDPAMDEFLRPVREEFAGRVAFRSLSWDALLAWEFPNAWGLTTADLPALVLFAGGRYEGLGLDLRSTSDVRWLVTDLVAGLHPGISVNSWSRKSTAQQLCLILGALAAGYGACMAFLILGFASMINPAIEGWERQREIWSKVLGSREFYFCLFLTVLGGCLFSCGTRSTRTSSTPARPERDEAGSQPGPCDAKG